MSLAFTGERFVPECAGEMVYEHWHRYLLARRCVAGKRVLDAACGEGYGSALLASAAASVVGIDLSAEAVAHASERYAGEHGNLRFVTASVASIPLPDASFDVIVSFETIEHMTEHEAFLREIDRLLAPDGMLIISSPNRPEYSDKTGYRNEFHVKELDRAELESLLDPHFSVQRWFAQRPAFHSLIWPLDAAASSAEALAIDGASGWPAELYFVVFAARNASALTDVGDAVTMVTDREQSVYAEWSRTYRENRELHERVRALEAETARRQATQSIPSTASAATNDAAPDPWLVRVARRLTGAR